MRDICRRGLFTGLVFHPWAITALGSCGHRSDFLDGQFIRIGALKSWIMISFREYQRGALEVWTVSFI